jgi:hypothetical protein
VLIRSASACERLENERQMSHIEPTGSSIDAATAMTTDDASRVHLVCVRPPGPFSAFDERVTRIAMRFVKVLRVSILRTWDHAAQHDWLGFVSASVPTVLIIRAGRILAKAVGDLPYQALEQILHDAAVAQPSLAAS